MRLGILLLALAPTLSAATLFFSGDLRTNATVVDCGFGCTLDSSNSDADYAQWAAVIIPFTISDPSAVDIVTFGWGGGTSATGPVVPAGGFEPYLSLFDAAGNFLMSTWPPVCPPAGNFIGSNCFDVLLDTGILGPGTYQLALTAFDNFSFAENLGSGTLADGFTGLGNLDVSENLNYALDIDIQQAPEPGTVSYLLLAAGLFVAGTTLKKKT